MKVKVNLTYYPDQASQSDFNKRFNDKEFESDLNFDESESEFNSLSLQYLIELRERSLVVVAC